MMLPLGSLALDLLLPLIAIAIALSAYRLARRRSPPRATEERVAMLEEQIRGLLYRVWVLERTAVARGEAPPPSPSPPDPGPVAGLAPAAWPPDRVPVASEAGGRTDAPAAPTGPPAAAPGAAPPHEPAADAALSPVTVDLEQRIGARWSTWVGIVALLFAASFFLKWSIDNELLGPRARVSIGGAAGIALVLAGFALRRRRDVPYLSEALAGLGLGVLYLSLWAAHALYELLSATPAFAAMVGTTALGAIVAVLSNRQITAALALLGGLLTPLLLRVERPDERNLLGYLLVLDLLVLAVARFRSWPNLNRLAWAGTAVLVAPVLARQPDAARPLTRLVLLSALFLLFLAVPLIRERFEYRRIGEVDLLLVLGNAAGYFWLVHATLDSWHPAAAGPWAVALAIVYRVAAADYAARVPGDPATAMLHETIAWTFLTIAVPLALDGQWVTLAWAVEGALLIWLASRMDTPVAAWGGLAALVCASVRVVALDRFWYPGATPIWNGTFLVHALVVVALGAGAWRARYMRLARLGAGARSTIENALWLIAALVLAVLFWREPSGLWPATLLTAELLVVAACARASAAPGFALATIGVAAILLARVFGADDLMARAAAASLVSRPLLSRVAACLAVAAAGSWLARSDAGWGARPIGRAMACVGGVGLLYALSVNWTRFQDAPAVGRRGSAEVRWRTQVGLSVLWAVYAAAALAWGFLRSAPAARYGALALLGLTVLKVFVVDLAAVRTIYRIVSFLILGVVLLLVGVLYQKRRPAREPAPTSAET